MNFLKVFRIGAVVARVLFDASDEIAAAMREDSPGGKRITLEEATEIVGAALPSAIPEIAAVIAS